MCARSMAASTRGKYSISGRSGWPKLPNPKNPGTKSTRSAMRPACFPAVVRPSSPVGMLAAAAEGGLVTTLEAVQDAPRSDSADAGEARHLAARGRRLDFRAEMGRLPRDRVPRRRRSFAAEPRPEAAQPLLPGARGPAPEPASTALRGGRGDRDRRTERARFRCAAAADPPGGFA